MYKVVTLSSCSKGNSTLIMGEQTNILIDAGLNLKNLIEKLNVLGVDPNTIGAILVTHEHSDHIKSVGPFCKKFGAYVFAHSKAISAIREKLGSLDSKKIVEFYDQEFEIGEFKINSFPLPHDSAYCVGYTVTKGNNKIAYATDLGHATTETINKLKDSKLVILESNHCEKMVVNSSYPEPLKRRILGKNGHLSNNHSAKVIQELAQNNVKQVMLAHLSLDNNTPELCYNTVCEYLSSVGIVAGVHIKVDIAPPFNLSTVFVLK